MTRFVTLQTSPRRFFVPCQAVAGQDVFVKSRRRPISSFQHSASLRPEGTPRRQPAKAALNCNYLSTTRKDITFEAKK